MPNVTLRRHLLYPNHKNEASLHRVKLIENNGDRKEQVKTMVNSRSRDTSTSSCFLLDTCRAAQSHIVKVLSVLIMDAKNRDCFFYILVLKRFC